MDALPEPGLEAAAVMHDAGIFAIGQYTGPFAEMDLPLVGGIEPVFHEVVFVVKIQDLAAEDLVGGILVGIGTCVDVLFQIGDQLLADVVTAPIVEIDEQYTSIEIRRNNLISVMYENIVTSLVFNPPTGIAVERSVP